MKRHQRKAVRRLSRVAQEGHGLWLITLTVESFPLGRLLDQINLILDVLSRVKSGNAYAALRRLHGIVGYFRALHILVTEQGCHAHVHLVVAARDQSSAQSAAEWIAERYCERLRRAGFPVTRQTIDTRRVPDPERLARYLTRLWRPEEGGSPFYLLLRGLQGDESALRAYEEICLALFNKRLFFGSGLFSKGAFS